MHAPAESFLLRLTGMVLSVTAFVLFLVPANGEAQQVRVLPSVGVYTPLSDLSDIRDQDDASIFEAGRRSATLAFGLGLEFQGAFRLQASYASSEEVPVDGVGCDDCELRSSLLMATAAAVIRPFPGLGPIRPYLVVGGGVKRHDFDRDEFDDGNFSEVFRTQTNPTLQLGLGTAVNLGALQPEFELSAFISRFDGVEDGTTSFFSDDNLQTDLFLTVSVPIGF